MGGGEPEDVPLSAVAVTLTLGTGAVDAASVIRLGGVFSSVMTGNLVVFGNAAGTGKVESLVGAGLALAGYAVGVAAGTGIARWVSAQVTGMLAALGAELLVLAVFAVGWLAGGERHVLLVLAASAMGLQSAAMRALGGRLAVSTTYLTGTLTGVISALLAPGLGVARLRDLAILTSLVAGAAAGTVTIFMVPAALPVIPLVTVVTAVAMTALAIRLRRTPARDAS